MLQKSPKGELGVYHKIVRPEDEEKKVVLLLSPASGKKPMELDVAGDILFFTEEKGLPQSAGRCTADFVDVHADGTPDLVSISCQIGFDGTRGHTSSIPVSGFYQHLLSRGLGRE